MRPKKVILLVDSDEDRQSITRFMLTVNGFAVLSYKTADSARQCERSFEVVLGYWPTDAGTLENLAHKVDGKFVLVAPTLTGVPNDVFADAILVRGETTPEWILERLKYACARKRGPKSDETLRQMAASAERAVCA